MICCIGNDPEPIAMLIPQYLASSPPSETCIATPPNCTMITCKTEVITNIDTNKGFFNKPLNTLTVKNQSNGKKNKVRNQFHVYNAGESNWSVKSHQ